MARRSWSSCFRPRGVRAVRQRATVSERSPATRGNVAGVPVLALEYHVDYWDYLGWKDPYSRDEFSERQGAYARTFGEPSVYTPEIVVQGRAALSNRSEATLSKVLRTESAASLVSVEVRTDGHWVTVHVAPRDEPPQAARATSSWRSLERPPFGSEQGRKRRQNPGARPHRSTTHESGRHGRQEVRHPRPHEPRRLLERQQRALRSLGTGPGVAKNHRRRRRYR